MYMQLEATSAQSNLLFSYPPQYKTFISYDEKRNDNDLIHEETYKVAKERNSTVIDLLATDL